MLNYEQFKEQFTEDLKKNLEGAGFNIEKVDVIPTEKLQQGTYDAVTVRLEDSFVGPSGNLTDVFEAYERSGGNYDALLTHVTEKFTDAIENMPIYDANQLTDYAFIKDKLVLEVVNAEKNEQMLENIPHKSIEDLAIVYRAQLGRDEDGIATVLITNQMLEKMDITAEQLHHDAVESAQELKPVTVNTIMGEIAELVGDDFDPGIETGGPMDNILVGSVADKNHGASVIAYPEFFDDMANKLGENFYIIPSSIHEVLIVPESMGTDINALKDMIEQVNATELRPEDVLSNNLYHYDAQDKVFEIAEKFEARQAEKQAEKEANPKRESAVKKLKDTEKAVAKEPPKKEIKPRVKDRGDQAI